MFGQPMAAAKQAAQVRKPRQAKPAPEGEQRGASLAAFEQAIREGCERWEILTGPAASGSPAAQRAISECGATLDDGRRLGRYLDATSNTGKPLDARLLRSRGWLAATLQQAKGWEERGAETPRWPGQRERAPTAPISTVRETNPQRAAEWAKLGRMGGGT